MKLLKILAGSLGAILIGAVGSGLWDLFLKKVILWTWDRSSAFASLGFSALRNIPYIDASKGSPHDTVIAFVSSLACMAFGMYMAKIDSLKPRSVSAASPEELSKRIRKGIWIARSLLIGMLFFVMLQLGQVRLTYQIVDDFNRNVAVLSLIAPKEAANYHLTFARMKSRDDFIKLMEDMRRSASVAHVQLPR